VCKKNESGGGGSQARTKKGGKHNEETMLLGVVKKRGRGQKIKGTRFCKFDGGGYSEKLIHPVTGKRVMANRGKMLLNGREGHFSRIRCDLGA